MVLAARLVAFVFGEAFLFNALVIKHFFLGAFAIAKDEMGGEEDLLYWFSRLGVLREGWGAHRLLDFEPFPVCSVFTNHLVYVCWQSTCARRVPRSILD